MTQLYQPQAAPPQPPQPKKTPTGVKVLVIGLIVVMGLIWLVSCGAIISAIGGEDTTDTTAQSAPSATPTASQSAPSATPSVVAQSYDSVEALRDAVVQAGYPCTAWFEHDADIKEKYAKESGQCSDADGLSIYADESDVQKNVDWSTGATLIVGPNWILFLPEVHIKRVHAALGGKLVDRPADPEPEPVEPEMPGIGDKVRDDNYQFTLPDGRRRLGRRYALSGGAWRRGGP